MKFLSIFLMILMLGSNPILAADVPDSNVSPRLTRLIEQLDELEKKQQQIILSQKKIIDEIQSLKIQSRR